MTTAENAGISRSDRLPIAAGFCKVLRARASLRPSVSGLSQPRKRVRNRATNCDESDAEPGAGDDELPGMGIRAAVMSLGGFGYLLKRRLER